MTRGAGRGRGSAAGGGAAFAVLGDMLELGPTPRPATTSWGPRRRRGLRRAGRRCGDHAARGGGRRARRAASPGPRWRRPPEAAPPVLDRPLDRPGRLDPRQSVARHAPRDAARRRTTAPPWAPRPGGVPSAVSPLSLLRDRVPGVNVFRYVSTRIGLATLTSLLITFLVAPWFIRRARARQLGEVIRDDGPAAHASKKGTPDHGRRAHHHGAGGGHAPLVRPAQHAGLAGAVVTVGYGGSASSTTTSSCRRRTRRGCRAS